MRQIEVVVVGSYNRDVSFAVARLPIAGETILSRGRLETPGGKGSNQAIQAARCGAATAMVAAIGGDAAGDEALALWARDDVDPSAVARLPEIGTGTAVILVEASGENLIVVDSGANSALAPVHVEAAAATIGSAKVVLAQLETPTAATRRAFELARAAGAVTLLNAAPAPERIDSDLLALTDVLIVNEGEGRAMSGEADAAAIGRHLLTQTARAVVVTLGSRGAALFARGVDPDVVPSPGVAVVDTTGAGDAFCGAFAARLAADGDLAAALRWGVAAGALACTAEGAAAACADAARIAALAEAAG